MLPPKTKRSAQMLAAFHRKWLAFRALEGRMRRPEAPRTVAHMGLQAVVVGVVVLCALNHHLLPAPQLHAIAQAAFCIAVAALYAVYMLISGLAHAVLACAEPRRNRDTARMRLIPTTDDHLCEDDDDNNNNEDPDDNNNTSSIIEPLPDAASIDDDDYYYYYHRQRDSSSSSADDNNNNEEPARLPRDVLIASMYFGGVGAFLALGPLCMWDCRVTLAFLFALLVLTLVTPPPAVATRWPLPACLAVCVACALVGASVLEHLRGADDADDGSNNNSSRVDPRLAALLAQFPRAPVWPFMLLGATSPFLLYLGGGSSDPTYHAMTTARTLETGLPVAVLLACVVLGWFSPIESALLMDIGAVPPSLIVLVAVAPPLLVAALALLLQALRTRSTLIALAFLTPVLVARQQHAALLTSSATSPAVLLPRLALGITLTAAAACPLLGGALLLLPPSAARRL